MTRADRFSATALVLFAGFIISQALRLSYWDEYGPGPGFVPFWLGVIIGIAAAVLFVRTLVPARPGLPDPQQGDGDPEWPDRGNAIRLTVVALLSMAAAAASLAIGMVPASGAFMLSVLFYLQPRRPVLNLVVSLLVPLFVWVVFVRWLTVPLPLGPLGF